MYKYFNLQKFVINNFESLKGVDFRNRLSHYIAHVKNNYFEKLFIIFHFFVLPSPIN